VELKLSIKPQINESDYIRMVISEQTEEIASSDPVLGPTTSKRTAKTTVVAKDQETVVLGGIMQDRIVESVTKVPVLGDIPVIGHVFREQSHKKFKTNLLLFLTPYIIKDPSDFRRIFERKMQERQQFIEQFYGQVPGYEATIDFARKAGPLAKIGKVLAREQSKVEFGGPGLPGERVLRPRGETPEVRPGEPRSPPPSSEPRPPPPLTPPPDSEPQVKPPPPDGSQLGIEGQPPAPSSPPNPNESLRVQPEVKDVPRE
jgi:general secretion pathway protein D